MPDITPTTRSHGPAACGLCGHAIRQGDDARMVPGRGFIHAHHPHGINGGAQGR